MVMTSLKPLDEVTGGNMFCAAARPDLRALGEGLGHRLRRLSTCAGIKGYFWNSIKMVVPAVLISTLLGALNGYVLTKWRFPGHKLVFGMMLFACFIPFQSVLIPMATILGKLGEFGTVARRLDRRLAGLRQSDRQSGASCTRVYGLGFTTLFFRNYYEAFPDRTGQGGDDRRRQLLPDFPAHPAAEFRRRSSSSPSSTSSPTSGTTSCSARPSRPATQAR